MLPPSARLVPSRTKLALSPEEEEKTIELKREVAAGQQRTVWNTLLSIPVKEFDSTETEIARIRPAIEMWDRYGVAADRRGLEPLLHALLFLYLTNSEKGVKRWDLTTHP